MIVVPSILSVIRKTATLARVLSTFVFRVPETPSGGSGIVHGQVTPAELLKLQKSGQFPDESVRIIIVSTIFPYFISGNLI